MTLGITVGKFYPFHKKHNYLKGKRYLMLEGMRDERMLKARMAIDSLLAFPPLKEL